MCPRVGAALPHEPRDGDPRLRLHVQERVHVVHEPRQAHQVHQPARMRHSALVTSYSFPLKLP